MCMAHGRIAIVTRHYENGQLIVPGEPVINNYTMTIDDKIKRVKRIYRQLDIHNSTFKRASGMACPENCGECCKKPDIEATVLEFLPAAYELYLSGEYEGILERLSSNEDPICVFFNPFREGGNCSMYGNRGLVCRLFGFSTRPDRNGKVVLVTCSILKRSMDQVIPGNNLQKAPVMPSYYMKLFGIDPQMSTTYFPVNEAIRKALEIVLFQFSHRKKPA